MSDISKSSIESLRESANRYQKLINNPEDHDPLPGRTVEEDVAWWKHQRDILLNEIARRE